MKPNFTILANNQDITDLMNGRLLSMSITDEIGAVSDTLSIDLDDRDCAFEIPPRGAELIVSLGYKDLYPMGRFIMDEVEVKCPPQTLILTARATNAALDEIGAFKTLRSHSWEKYTLLGIIQTIAKRYGLQESVSAAYKQILVDHIDQTEESDSAFIQRLASEYGAAVKTAGGKLLFIEPLSGKFPDGTPMPEIAITDISSYRMRISDRGKYNKIVAKYYDFDRAEEKEVSVGTGSPSTTLRDTYLNATRAKAAAQAKLRETTTGTHNLTLDIVGNPLIGAESLISVSGIRADACGLWVVKSAKHTLNSSGYKTQIEATRPKGE